MNTVSESAAETSDSPPTAGKSPSGGLRAMVDNPWVVLGLLFFVMAALGIPVLWGSRGFSIPSKIFWTIAVSIYTVLILWGFYLVMAWCYHTIATSLGF